MFDNALVRAAGLGGEADLGLVAESMLFYQHLNILLDHVKLR